MPEQASQHSADTRLASYGTLAPGRINHHQLDGLVGAWSTGTVRGRLIEFGWGADLGFPGLILEAEGEEVALAIFESFDLPQHWARLDEFEGENYHRQTCWVDTPDGPLEVMLYTVNP